MQKQFQGVYDAVTKGRLKLYCSCTNTPMFRAILSESRPAFHKFSRSMSSMKAIVVDKPGGPEALQFKDAPKPKAEAGQILVKNHAIGNRLGTFRSSSLSHVLLILRASPISFNVTHRCQLHRYLSSQGHLSNAYSFHSRSRRVSYL